MAHLAVNHSTVNQIHFKISSNFLLPQLKVYPRRFKGGAGRLKNIYITLNKYANNPGVQQSGWYCLLIIKTFLIFGLPTEFLSIHSICRRPSLTGAAIIFKKLLRSKPLLWQYTPADSRAGQSISKIYNRGQACCTSRRQI